MSRRREWITAAVVVVVALAFAGAVLTPFVYINFIKEDAPARFTLDDSPTTTAAGSAAATTTRPATASPTTTAPSSDETTAPSSDGTADPSDGGGSLDGPWAITGTDSLVGYRVVEVLFGQDTEGVGRTSAVTGQLELAGSQVSTASFSVDMTTVKSDENRRDNQFNNNLMNVREFPTATFELTAPIDLGAEPADGQEIAAQATGNLTLRGVTKPVTLEVQAKRTGTTIQVVGSTDIVFADYGIPNPDAPGVSTQDHGLLEFDLRFTKA